MSLEALPPTRVAVGFNTLAPVSASADVYGTATCRPPIAVLLHAWSRVELIRRSVVFWPPGARECRRLGIDVLLVSALFMQVGRSFGEDQWLQIFP